MKDYEVIIRDWADRNNVVVEHIIETSPEIEVYAYNVHYQDLAKLNKLEENWYISFIDPVSEEKIKITIVFN